MKIFVEFEVFEYGEQQFCAARLPTVYPDGVKLYTVAAGASMHPEARREAIEAVTKAVGRILADSETDSGAPLNWANP